MRKHLETEAIAALRDTLRQVSVINVKEITKEIRGKSSREGMLLGHVEIYGHAHLLACKVVPDCQASHVKDALRDLAGVEKRRGVVAVPILIAPSISEKTQNLCRENGIGFLDLDGNARLYLDEVFIVKRSMHHKKLPSPAETLPTSETAHFAHMA